MSTLSKLDQAIFAGDAAGIAEVAAAAAQYAGGSMDPGERADGVTLSQAAVLHLQDRYGEAIALASGINESSAAWPSALAQVGRSRHNEGDCKQALADFAAATQTAPGRFDLWFYRGLAERAAGNLPAATASFGRSRELAPEAYRPVFELGVTRLMAEDIDGALDAYRAALALKPGDPAAHKGLGLTAQLVGQLDEALSHYQAACAANPDDAELHYFIGSLHNEEQRSGAAIDALIDALRLDPDLIDAAAELAVAFERSNRIDDAQAVIERSIERVGPAPPLLIEAAKLARRQGHAEQAAAMLERLPIDQLPPRLAMLAWHEAGLAQDRMGLADAAVASIENANAIAARNPRRRAFDPKAFGGRVAEIQAWTSAGMPGPKRSAASDKALGAGNIFLVGFPRSGTTLLDMMLERHRQIAVIEEQPIFETTVMPSLGVRDRNWPTPLALASPTALGAAAESYQQRLSSHLATQSNEPRPTVIVDKLPLRILETGLIDRVLPQAKLLLSLRHPCDVVLSNFFQLYAPNEAFIHFDTIAESVETYCAAMSVWLAIRDRLGAEIETIRYEDLIKDPEAELRRVCAFLGVAFEPDMLDEAGRTRQRDRVTTNSYQQIAEPLYQRSVGRWQQYRRQLAPHLDALAPFIEAFGYVEKT